MNKYVDDLKLSAKDYCYYELFVIDFHLLTYFACYITRSLYIFFICDDVVTLAEILALLNYYAY